MTTRKMQYPLIRRHPIIMYFLIAYAFSWSIGGLLIATH